MFHKNGREIERKKWKGNSGAFAALVTDFPRAFDFLSRQLLTARLNADELYLKTLRLKYNSLSHRKQRIKFSNNYSS